MKGLKDVEARPLFADMHTHSEFSHDSACKIADMASAQISKGTKIFAVTDHFDTDLYGKQDIFAPIKASVDTCRRVNEEYGDRCTLLSGVEIGEGFWNTEVYRRIMALADYDVILGSVHQVRFGSLTEAYSQIDFSALPKETILSYMDAYFDDMLSMIETTEFDILCHLTCPLRYINGKYGLGMDISPFSEKIDNILKAVIGKGISLEVNTSGTDTFSDYMPPREVVKRYFDLGGRMVTLGSDAHKAQDASKGFDQGVQMLKDIGFDGIYYYKSRKPIKIKI